jgi:hypothetical protein
LIGEKKQSKQLIVNCAGNQPTVENNYGSTGNQSDFSITQMNNALLPIYAINNVLLKRIIFNKRYYLFE